MSELKGKKEIKVVPLYEQIQKQFVPDLNPQNSLFWPQKSQKTTLKIGQIKNKI